MMKYDDIISLPHHVSSKHAHMPMRDRAAQFAPFAALKGYDGVISEEARITLEKREPDENFAEILSTRLRFIADNPDSAFEVTLTYFLPDKNKSGGSFAEKTGRIKKIDDIEMTVVFEDGKSVDIRDITDILIND